MAERPSLGVGLAIVGRTGAEGASLVADSLVEDTPPRTSRWRRVVWWAAVGLTALLIVTTLAGFFGSRSWALDLLANLRGQLAVGLIVLAGVLFALRSRWAAGLAAAAAAVNLVLVVPLLIPGGTPDVPPGAETFDITFLNVKHRAADPEAVFDYLEDRDDDLVVLAATSRLWVEAFESSGLDLQFVDGPRRLYNSQLTVLAKDPAAVGFSIMRAGDGARSTVVEASVTLDGRTLRILATHPVSPMTPARAARRDAQFAWIADRAQQSEDPVVVIGDLNATPWSSAFRTLVDEAGLVDSQHSHGMQPSWPAWLGPLGLTLDHVLHSPNAVVIDRYLGPSFGSDHRTLHTRVGHAADSS